MPITVNHKKPAGYVVFRANSTSGLKLNTSNGLAGANTIGESVESMAISEVMWSVSSAGSWTVKRGANTVAVFSGSGYHDYQASGIRLEQNSFELSANLDLTLSGTGVITFKVHKVSGE
jgi:hypothetical protein